MVIETKMMLNRKWCKCQNDNIDRDQDIFLDFMMIYRIQKVIVMMWMTGMIVMVMGSAMTEMMIMVITS